MKIVRAQALGMCFGVRDAIAMAHTVRNQGPVTILGDLVHNPVVLADLARRGIGLESRLDEIRTQMVMITAHGASQRRMAEVQTRGHQVLQATCPLVQYAHRALAALVAAGHHPIIIGQRGHIEVRGMTEDYPQADVILTDDDVRQLLVRSSFGVVAQTTQPVGRVRQLVSCLERLFPESAVHFRDTVCLPTKQRQEAARDLSDSCTVVVVIGGPHSNNTRELAETIRQAGRRVHQISGPDELRLEWFCESDTVGITAGTSSPDTVIDAVENRLQEWAEFLLKSRETPAELTV